MTAYGTSTASLDLSVVCHRTVIQVPARPLLKWWRESWSWESMYETFYGLREKPFSILPDPDLIFWGKTHSMAFTMLEFGVMNNAGFTVITGEIGSGKTTLVRYLLKKLAPTISIGLISNTPQGRQELMQWVLM